MNLPTDSFAEPSAAPSRHPNILTVQGMLDPASALTELRLPDGRTIQIATALLQPSASFEPASQTTDSSLSSPHVIPILEEQLHVGKRTTITGKVLLEKHTLAYDEQLDVPLAVRTYDVERIVLNRPVESAPAIRQEGATTIYPLVEEQLVLTTKLILREELRITQRDSERRDTRTVTLHRETIEVTRTPATE